MGRIAPRKRKVTWGYQALLRLCQRFVHRPPALSGDEGENRPLPSSSGQRIKAAFNKVWHLPDGYRWMEPLPLFHRRWILVAIGVLLLTLLWPYSPPPVQSPQPLPVASEQPAPMQAEIIDNRPPAEQPPAIPPAPPVQPEPQNTEIPWRNYEVASGQTLAQLFRDNNLPVGDVFAMAQVEGDDKPLSNLRVGQEVKLQLNTQGAVAVLEIETTDNQVVRFTRNADGAFTRTR
ncbi:MULTISPECIES: LysM-like peptidoglycan-binding domain-containing protein [unclassified Brenneria]|uniref:LysM-like peptidoglycan-binding domain-containing protein n=1 Tax=unclassified Brenneria TaxID=2634434 RepID=UPI001552B440|nr:MULTISPECIES: LysM-like peptidoglycan-binding domain-containing protein [unclassified Brenneria]MBJ7223694.1 Opacity-associated protein A [Brenneria sp. L3-3C-1]MEE3644936.1 LysM-like peptidoglycan-binding domain-containing protein [Brenneria sp. L3_3C_1]MEE3652314.1 LysM-like peptidoglycan-binding domain-containing protein [Brenneria sp. HEZEL_4_2_4]NPD02271.1 Opacity-associated protein A [Brenneria sp. hezel4-2-4]